LSTFKKGQTILFLANSFKKGQMATLNRREVSKCEEREGEGERGGGEIEEGGGIKVEIKKPIFTFDVQILSRNTIVLQCKLQQ